jgi:hypothetical protein
VKAIDVQRAWREQIHARSSPDWELDTVVTTMEDVLQLLVDREQRDAELDALKAQIGELMKGRM